MKKAQSDRSRRPDHKLGWTRIRACCQEQARGSRLAAVASDEESPAAV